MSSDSNRARSPSPNVEDDPDLALAIALSLQQDDNVGSSRPENARPSAKLSEQPIKPHAAINFGPLALDRKKMEEERLARLKKRSATQADLDDQHQKSKLQRPEAPPNPKTPAIDPGLLKTATQVKDDAQLPFANGAFKRTWALGYPRTGEDIKIEEVLQKDKLQLAVLSSFQWDEEWLLSKVNPSRTKMMLVAYAANEAEVCFLKWTKYKFTIT